VLCSVVVYCVCMCVYVNFREFTCDTEATVAESYMGMSKQMLGHRNICLKDISENMFNHTVSRAFRGDERMIRSTGTQSTMAPIRHNALSDFSSWAQERVCVLTLVLNHVCVLTLTLTLILILNRICVLTLTLILILNHVCVLTLSLRLVLNYICN
jgi:hypothetical protein